MKELCANCVGWFDIDELIPRVSDDDREIYLCRDCVIEIDPPIYDENWVYQKPKRREQ